MMLGKVGMFDMIVDQYATEDVIKISKRLLKERWFTLPFRPFKKLKTTIIKRPAIYMFENKLLIHPYLENKLLNSLPLGSDAIHSWMGYN